jgi:peptidoglycan/LPS O-acetylase OafA/YrhL
MVFFVISGYCIVAAAYSGILRGKSVWQYSFDRIRRIYPPYLAALALTALSLSIIAFANNHHLIAQVNHLTPLPRSFRYWIANLLLLQYELNTPMINEVFWSLGYEIAFYCIVGCFFALAARLSKKGLLPEAAELLLWCLGISTMGTLTWMLIFGHAWFPFDGWHQFSIGGLLFFLIEIKPNLNDSNPNRLRKAIWVNVVGVTVLTLIFALLQQGGDGDPGHPSSRIRSLVCLGFALCLMPLKIIDERIVGYSVLKPFTWVGIFSYSLYLTHPIIVPYVDIISRKVGLNGDRYWVAFWLQFVSAIIFARLFFEVVERHFISKKQVQRIASENIKSLI